MIAVWLKVKVILGIGLCLIGVAGTLVPIIPGLPIILSGVALLGTDHPLVVKIKGRLTRWRKGRNNFQS